MPQRMCCSRGPRGGQRTTCRRQFSPSAMRAPGMGPGASRLTQALAHQASWAQFLSLSCLAKWWAHGGELRRRTEKQMKSREGVLTPCPLGAWGQLSFFLTCKRESRVTDLILFGTSLYIQNLLWRGRVAWDVDAHGCKWGAGCPGDGRGWRSLLSLQMFVLLRLLTRANRGHSVKAIWTLNLL